MLGPGEKCAILDFNMVIYKACLEAPQAKILRFQGATNEFYIENEPPEASQLLLCRKMFYPDLRRWVKFYPDLCRWVQFLPASLRRRVQNCTAEG